MTVKKTKGPWKLFTAANFITYVGFVTLFFAGLYAWRGEKSVAFFYYLVSALTDYFDGRIARFTRDFVERPVVIVVPGSQDFWGKLIYRMESGTERIREWAKKNTWFFGISRLGELLDPLRDKLLLVPAILIQPAILWIVPVELVSSLFSGIVRKMLGYHKISDTSRVATFVQLPAVMLLFLAQLPGDISILIVVIYLCSVARLLSYLWITIEISAGRIMKLVKDEEKSKAA